MKKIILGAFLMAPFVVLPLIAQEYVSNSSASKLSECTAIELYTHSPKHANKDIELEKTTKIPAGWSLIGGSGGGGHPTMIVCR
jgi:hypothetical protein